MMTPKSHLVPLVFLLLPILSKAQGGLCPTDDNFSATCLSSVMPPYPICTKRGAAEWVAHAQDAVPRCCGKDKSACGCPVKDSQDFLDVIDGKCEGIASCPEGNVLMGHSLLRGFEMEEQIQREEMSNAGGD